MLVPELCKDDSYHKVCEGVVSIFHQWGWRNITKGRWRYTGALCSGWQLAVWQAVWASGKFPVKLCGRCGATTHFWLRTGLCWYQRLQNWSFWWSDIWTRWVHHVGFIVQNLCPINRIVRKFSNLTKHLKFYKQHDQRFDRSDIDNIIDMHIIFSSWLELMTPRNNCACKLQGAWVRILLTLHCMALWQFVLVCDNGFGSHQWYHWLHGISLLITLVFRKINRERI